MGKMKGRSGGSKKSTSAKVGNKTSSKLAKRGKLKKGKIKKKQKENEKRLRGIKSDESVRYKRTERLDSEGEDGQDDEEIDEGDIKYFTTPGRDFSFLSNLSESLQLPDSNRRKRKRKADDYMDFEQTPRKISADKNVRHLLPIKDQGKIIEQTVPKTETTEEVENIEEVDSTPVNEEEVQEELPPMTAAEIYLLRQKTLTHLKEKIAGYAHDILANPEENLKKLKELRQMLKDPSMLTSVHKLLVISLMEIFKDLIPGYRIRVLTDKEKEHQLKKDTKQLMNYETSFLLHYKHYIEHLQSAVRRFKNEKVKHLKSLTDEAKQGLFEVSVKCLSSLLSHHPHFNYRKDLIQTVIPFMNHKKPEVSTHICQCVINVFKTDKLGDATLEVVRAIGKFLKSKDFNNIQPKVLETYLSLRITDIEKLISETAPKQDKKKSEDMSRKERKKKKKMRVLENELLETKATEDKTKRLKLHTETLETVFHTYFRILKSATNSPLLPAVLEGLAKFAHLINIQFFNDLFTVLNKLIDSGELGYREILHCVQSAFTILTGQGSSLNIDPVTFYRHLYISLLQVDCGIGSNNISIILPCLYIIIMKQKRKLSQQKVLAFMKRLSTMSLHQLPGGALSFLAAVKQFLHAYPCSDMLYDGESQGSGVFLPELDQPEYSNAHTTILWELHTLRNHYNSSVRSYCKHLRHQAPTTGEGQLPSDLLRMNPEELYREHEKIMAVDILDKMPSTVKRHKKILKSSSFKDEKLNEWMNTKIQNVPLVTDFYLTSESDHIIK